MSAKCLDQQGRWRNKVVAFRMSPEEDELLETAVRLSGLTKQDYIIRRLQEKEVTVTGNPRVYNGDAGVIYKIENCTIRRRTGKSSTGISGQAWNIGQLPMVIVLAVCPMTGACHAPVDSKQGSTCTKSRRGCQTIGI